MYKIIALENGHIDSCIKMIEALQNCSLDTKITILRGLMVSTSTYFDSLEEVLRGTGEIVYKCLDDHKRTLGSDINFYRLLSMTMRVMENRGWFNVNDKGKKPRCSNISNIFMLCIHVN